MHLEHKIVSNAYYFTRIILFRDRIYEDGGPESWQHGKFRFQQYLELTRGNIVRHRTLELKQIKRF